MAAHYVVDENGERVAVYLEIEEYERLMAQQPEEDDEHFDPEEAERRITEFVESADELPGSSVEDLAYYASEAVLGAWVAIESEMSDKPHNKVLAAQLLLGQRARGMQPDDPEQWRLHAATTLLSGMISTSSDTPG